MAPRLAQDLVHVGRAAAQDSSIRTSTMPATGRPRNTATMITPMIPANTADAAPGG